MKMLNISHLALRLEIGAVFPACEGKKGARKADPLEAIEIKRRPLKRGGKRLPRPLRYFVSPILVKLFLLLQMCFHGH